MRPQAGKTTADLEQELALARAEPHALADLSLEQITSLGGQLKEAVDRCDAYEKSLRQKLNECTICYDAPRQGVFVPCGHWALCQGCASRVMLCPICQAPIKMWQPVFSS